MPALDDFHRLVQDEHVRRYLMDGQIFPREWSEQRIIESAALFDRRGVGLWLVHDNESGEIVGFCGFLEQLGFRTVATQPGSFGDLLRLTLED